MEKFSAGVAEPENSLSTGCAGIEELCTDGAHIVPFSELLERKGIYIVLMRLSSGGNNENITVKAYTFMQCGYDGLLMLNNVTYEIEGIAESKTIKPEDVYLIVRADIDAGYRNMLETEAEKLYTQAQHLIRIQADPQPISTPVPMGSVH